MWGYWTRNIQLLETSLQQNSYTCLAPVKRFKLANKPNLILFVAVLHICLQNIMKNWVIFLRHRVCRSVKKGKEIMAINMFLLIVGTKRWKGAPLLWINSHKQSRLSFLAPESGEKQINIWTMTSIDFWRHEKEPNRAKTAEEALSWSLLFVDFFVFSLVAVVRSVCVCVCVYVCVCVCACVWCFAPKSESTKIVLPYRWDFYPQFLPEFTHIPTRSSTLNRWKTT